MRHRRIVITKLHCLRCGHVWVPNKEDVTVCPRCKNPYWNLPKRKRAGEKDAQSDNQGEHLDIAKSQ